MVTLKTSDSGRNGKHATTKATTPANPCPKCGGGRAGNNRCWSCNPWHRDRRPAAEFVATAPFPDPLVRLVDSGGTPIPSRFAAPAQATATIAAETIDPEVRAMVSVVAALNRLDDESRRRVLGYVAARFMAETAPAAGEGGER